MKKEKMLIGVGVGIFLVVLGVWYFYTTHTSALVQGEREKVVEVPAAAPAMDELPKPFAPEEATVSETACSVYRKEDLPPIELVVAESAEAPPSRDVAPKEHPPESRLVMEEFRVPENLHPCIKGSVGVTLKRNGKERKFEILYKVPVDGKGYPLRSAKNIIFDAPFTISPIKEGSEGIRESFFSGGLGFTVLTIRVPAGEKALVPRNALTDDECFWKPDSGVMEAVFAGQEKVAQKFHLPPERLMVMGESMGSAMVQTMAAKYPDKIRAAAIVGSPTLEAAEGSNDVAWLLVHTRGQSNSAEYREFADSLRKKGASVIYAVTPPLWEKRGDSFGNYHHSPSKEVYSMVYGYFAGLAKLAQSGESGKGFREWPYLIDVQDEKKEVLETSSPKGMAVPVERRCYFPSRSSAQIWAGLQPYKKVVELPLAEGGVEVFCTRPSIYQKPRGVVLYECKYDYTTINRIVEDLYYFSAQGYMGVAPKNKPPLRPGRWGEYLKATMDWVQSQENCRGLPIYVVGIGEAIPVVLEGVERGWLAPKAIALNKYFVPEASPGAGGATDGGKLPFFDKTLSCPLALVDNEEDRAGAPELVVQTEDWVKERAGKGEAVSVGCTKEIPVPKAAKPPKKKKNKDGSEESVPEAPQRHKDLETPRSWKEIEMIERFFSEGTLEVAAEPVRSEPKE